jgi:hypothetical protein
MACKRKNFVFSIKKQREQKFSAGKKFWDTAAPQKYLPRILLIIKDIRLKICVHILHDIYRSVTQTRPL